MNHVPNQHLVPAVIQGLTRQDVLDELRRRALAGSLAGQTGGTLKYHEDGPLKGYWTLPILTIPMEPRSVSRKGMALSAAGGAVSGLAMFVISWLVTNSIPPALCLAVPLAAGFLIARHMRRRTVTVTTTTQVRM